MTVSEKNNDDSNNTIESAPKRKTISLGIAGVSNVSPGSHSVSKDLKVEVKKRKGINLKLLKPEATKNEQTQKTMAKTPTSGNQTSTGKLTDQEFLNRVKVLQEAMKTEVQEIYERLDDTDSSVEQTHAEQSLQTEKSEPFVKPESRSNRNDTGRTKTKPYARKENERSFVSEPVVFKSSDYTPRKSSKPKTATASEPVLNFPPSSSVASEVGPNKKFQSPRAKKSSDIGEMRKKAWAPRNQSKKIETGRKISRAVLDRVLDNDLEERTRSIASFKRAKQKLKNTGEHQEAIKIVREVNIPDMITISELANRMAVRGAEVIKYLMKIGTMATLNQSIDGDTAEVICTEFGHTPKRVSEADIENEIEKVVDDPKSLQPRAPIVAIMGHVDHGKTTLLDTLRQTSVAAKEAGGITQHIASYQITTKDGKKITFIDTPGHAAFSKIRSRGAVITDVIVLIVAADDGIKDQTIEAIAHAKAQNVPVVVAINKIDKPHVSVERVKTDLMNHEIILEDFGGEVLSAEISALKNLGLEELLDTILLQSEMLQLKANPDRRAVGTVLESRMAKGKGIVASVIVQAGTLKPGDVFVAGASYGRVRSIFDDCGKRINFAGPSQPIEIVGFNNYPEPGDSFVVMESESKAREIAEYRERIQKEKTNTNSVKTIDQLMAGQKDHKKTLNVFIKADVAGSVEALSASLLAIQHPEVEVQITSSGIGMVNESDVDFAKNTGSLIIGFNVGITSIAKDSAKQNGLSIYTNSVIYHIIEAVKAKLSELLPPLIEENYIGNADVRKIFIISRLGTIAGCYVTDGIIKKADSKIKVIRKGENIFTGKIRSIKHEKDEIKEAKQSHECGILVEGFNDFKEGDQIECFEIVQKKRFVD